MTTPSQGYHQDMTHDDPQVTLFRFLWWVLERHRDGRQLALELHRANPDNNNLKRSYERMEEIGPMIWDALNWARPAGTGYCKDEQHYLYGGETECRHCEFKRDLVEAERPHFYTVMDALSTGTDEDVVAEALLKLYDREERDAILILEQMESELGTAYPHRFVRIRPEMRAVIHKVREEATNLRWNEEAQG